MRPKCLETKTNPEKKPMKTDYKPLPLPLRALRHHVTGAIERGEAEPIKEAPAAGVTLTPCGNYAAQLPTGEFIAEQNGTQWKQDTAQGWSLCTTRKEAQNVADRYNRAAASKAAKA